MERNVRFFGEQFEINILEIQTKYIEDKKVIETEIDFQKQRLELLERNNVDQEKKDMWDDQNLLSGTSGNYDCSTLLGNRRKFMSY